MKSNSNNSYSLSLFFLNHSLDSWIASRKAVLYTKMFLILKGQFKMLPWEKLLNKEKVLEKKGFISFFSVDKKDMV